ncbi:Uncharacterised protein [Shewanella morhuae]|uniref:Uncharacterized protein n=1 Tax=Shewanella morhuae TaxID=365591 RepID=A0A380AR57_9GAMM|nr:Uncharacterised protein [Shewanella morhuae]
MLCLPPVTQLDFIVQQRYVSTKETRYGVFI